MIYVAGHRGLVGSAVVGALQRQGYTNLLLRTRDELDLGRQDQVDAFMARERPAAVILAAAVVGGIGANSARPATFIGENLRIQDNVIDAAYRCGVQKLVFLGSSCIYPRLCPQPIREEYLLSGPLEPTNEAYAIAKIAGIKMCQAYRRQFGFGAISLMPTNLYGPGDNFDLQNSHVLPALIRRFHEARMAGAPSVTIWGSGSPRREFLHVDDLAGAILHLMDTYDSGEIVNVGCGEDLTIRDLAAQVAATVGYPGEILFDTSRPDGTPQKLLDVSRIRQLGWAPRISLQEGLRSTYAWFQNHVTDARRGPALS